jgi:hypothetical protein
MQGSVWGGLNCTTTLDKLNKILLQEEQTRYFYKGDHNIPIGVLGMVDDTLSIANCGIQSIHKNAIINSFIENQRLTLSHEKSAVVHVGNVAKCRQACSNLLVHDKSMKVEKSVKYLGDRLSTTGNVKETVESRRSEGWGKVSQIVAILSEIPCGKYRMQIGLQLRESKLVNGMLYNSEAWSSITERELLRMEQVDFSLMRALMGGGHSKCGIEFYLLELGLLKLCHIITQRRMIFHHHILTRNEDETIKKVYLKQKEENTKGDWYEMLLKDFEFIGEEVNDEVIKNTDKLAYKKMVKEKVKKAAFKCYI